MLKKCDFCACYDPIDGVCEGGTRFSQCSDAADAFAEYMNNVARNRNVRTNNVNVNKSKHSYHHHSKGKNSYGKKKY